MSTLTLLVGPPGSGKSTYAHNLVETWKQPFSLPMYINQDKQGKEHLEIFKNAIASEFNIVVDRMNFSKEQRDRYLKLAKEAGYTTEIIVFHESYDTCYNRCIERQNHPSIKTADQASRALDMFFRKYERVEDGEADTVIRKWPEGKKLQVIVSDLDGTLCNIDHRLHYVKGEGKKDWKSFFRAISNDVVNEPVMEILKRFENAVCVVYCSGRPDDYYKETLDWLGKYNAPFGSLVMRRRGDSRSDVVVKQIILDFELLTRFNILFVIDDRPSVCRMWRKNGLTCLQVNDKEF